MPYGLVIKNAGGDLVVDSSAKGLHYVGQATYIGNTTARNDTNFLNRVYRRYAITLSSPSAIPLAAIRPTPDRWMSVEYVRRSAAGSATWHIDIYSADASALAFNATDMQATASAEVHVFASGVVSAATAGLRLRDSSGAVSWDFGAKPLFVTQVMQFPQRTDRTTYRNGDAMAFAAGMVSPLIVNASSHGKDNNAVGTAGTHNDSKYVFQTDGAGNLKRVLLGTYRERGERLGEPYTPQPDWALPARLLFVVDSAIY